MFIETDEGRLQNLYLLQDVRVMNNSNDIEPDETIKYFVGYIQSNGMVILEGNYSTEAEAQDKVDEIKAKLLDEGGIVL